jgi:hypothetical protein
MKKPDIDWKNSPAWPENPPKKSGVNGTGIVRAGPPKTHGKSAVIAKRQRCWAKADTFPTRDRANTYSDIQRLAAASGFTVEQIDRIEGRPEVLRIAWPTDLLGAAYERRVNAWDGLAMFRILLVGELRKG